MYEVQFEYEYFRETETTIYVTAYVRLVGDSFDAHNGLGDLQSYDASYLECTDVSAVYVHNEPVELTPKEIEKLKEIAIEQDYESVD